MSVKFIILLISIFVSFPVSSGKSVNTEIISSPKDAIEQTAKRKNVLLFALLENGDDIDQALKQGVMKNLASISSKLSRFKLLQESQFIDKIFSGDEADKSQISRQTLIDESKKLGLDEILLVSGLSFSQVGVKPEEIEDDEKDDHSFWENVIIAFFTELFFGSNDADIDATYPNNIQSELVVSIAQLDLSTGDVINNIYFDELYTGGNLAESKKEIFALFNADLTKKIRGLYPIHGVSYTESQRYVLLKKGRSDGIKPGLLFDVMRHDKVIIIDGDEIIRPGERVAIAQAVDISESSSRLKVVRHWDVVEKTQNIKENQNTVLSINLLTSKNIDNTGFKIGADIMLRPFSTFDVGFGVKYLRATDSRGDSTQGPSFDFIGALHFYHSSVVSMSLQSGVNLNLLFRSDDADNTVFGVIAGVPILLNFEYKLNQNWNAFFSMGYLFSNKNPDWNISKETGRKDENGDAITENVPGTWNGSVPDIDISGAIVKLGMKRYLF